MRTARLFPVVVGLSALLLTGCTEDSHLASQDSDVFASIQERHAVASRADGIYDTPRDAMPQVRYIVNDETEYVSDAYVLGKLLTVEPGRSFRYDRAESSSTTTEVDFNAPNAEVSTIHLVLQIKRSIVAPDQYEDIIQDLSPGNEVTLGLALAAPVNVEAVKKDLSTETLAALLYKPSNVFAYDENVWAILQDGAYLGKVNGSETVTFSGLDSPGPGGDDAPREVSTRELERPHTGKPKKFKFDAKKARYDRLIDDEPSPASDEVAPTDGPSTGEPSTGDVPASRIGDEPSSSPES